jgi:hypothetical protein
MNSLQIAVPSPLNVRLRDILTKEFPTGISWDELVSESTDELERSRLCRHAVVTTGDFGCALVI